jgi:hypothetical protein
MLPFAWICAVLGAILAYIVSLAGAMRTVPQLYWQEALVAVKTHAVEPKRARICFLCFGATC